MSASGDNRRSYGSGSLFVYRGSWYGKWRIGSRQVKRKIGPKRRPATREGLTRSQAERELRRLMREVKPTPQERLTLREVGDAYIAHLRDYLKRKPSTIQDYGIILGKAEKGLPKKAIDALDAGDLGGFVAAMQAEGLSPKTINNRLNFLHGLFSFALKRGWAHVNPVAAIERPRSGDTDPDIRFLDRDEIEALITAVPDDRLGEVERPLYVTATMCGLRQGELLALRWLDVDWNARVIRVRRNYTRGQFGRPKSRRSTRSVPMPRRVAAELRRLHSRSDHTGDTDLVFCHPDTGNPYDASKMRKRFKEAVAVVGIRPVRFHDLRHTFGTRMAAAGAPLRTIQEWMGHRDYKTTEIYADFAPDPSQEAGWAEAAFGDVNAEEDDAPDDRDPDLPPETDG
ncbi:MAG: tyrosine-type recombinase/integrase [Solirubrobacterales bacterium]